MMYYSSTQRGFTLIELLVAIAIIGLLSSVVLASLSAAREKSRDARRMSDLRQIQRAMEFYYDDNGYYPREGDGANGLIGEGAGLDTMLAPYLSVIPHDPLGPGSGTYNYYYDGRQSCGGREPIAVIFARNMETTPTNRSDFCSSWGGEGGAGTANAWHIVIGPSDD
jgi:type II secretion system protein G